MKVLVTGGAGYIGSNLVDTLLARGETVVVLDDFSLGKHENIDHNLSNQSFQLVEGSVTDAAAVASAMDGCELVYHLAARVGIKYIVDDPLRGILTNVAGTETILKEAYRRGIKVLLASTSEIYGKSDGIPFSEDGDRVLGATSVARWSYSSAKAIDEHLAFAYAREGLRMAIVRYFNSYGPRLDPVGYGSVMAKFIMQAVTGQPLTVHSDGKQSRSFTFVEDTVEGTIRVATAPEAEGQVFNIGCNRETTVLELARMVRSATGSSSPIIHVEFSSFFGPNFEDIPRRVPNVEKARRVLGFEAGVPLEEGLQTTVAWMRQKLGC
ncbi:MAG: NAD-dependent epimerase/dehydratase family protein [Dehalococcoidia bacterium]|nr:NAD-dependent epimerase/dehydratase family protein [Dehalococcoidia bacterium]